ncbi:MULTISPECIES: hypothetical protein [Pseudomonas]|jgi:hypothetical protein|uniref:hypothetical protein n=1 Tax=Pseudomonas TaxID=286 RepID=UPI00159D7E2C|nr:MULTISPECIES: hypothetical protein [Pseudomonas]MBP2285745.1 hypothetical protein [Pseudomonas sp. BP7]NVN62494.1 hypothetical protein [Pseudomonas putida]NVN67486.1 hypothetical protein [Pseudomonas putida]HDS1697346.1 hypothetical protein [Pseudomonas putida]HDS1702504.1 hypothetical protein [Pseudomonas putida]
MNLSWFDDWRFDMRGPTAFREIARGEVRHGKKPIIRSALPAAQQLPPVLVDWQPCFLRVILVPISNLSRGLPA